jgi:hypothetical protein
MKKFWSGEAPLRMTSPDTGSQKAKKRRSAIFLQGSYNQYLAKEATFFLMKRTQRES